MSSDRPVVADTHLPITIENSDLSHDGFRQVITYQYREDESDRSPDGRSSGDSMRWPWSPMIPNSINW